MDTMAEYDQEGNSTVAVSVAGESYQPQLPISRVKKIMKLDQDINKVNSTALHLIASSTELFLESLAEKSAQVALEKNRKTIKLENLRVAIKRHQPTSDFLLNFLLDFLPMLPSQSSDLSPKVSFTPTLQQNDIKAGLRSAFSTMEGSLSVVDWCKGRSQSNDGGISSDGFSAECTASASECRDSSNTISLSVGEPISPSQSSAGGSSSFRDGIRVDEASERRLSQDTCLSESENLLGSRLSTMLDAVPAKMIVETGHKPGRAKLYLTTHKKEGRLYVNEVEKRFVTVVGNNAVNYIEEAEIIRLVDSFSPSLWGDIFLSFSIDDHEETRSIVTTRILG
ncbi:hypothetical protein P3S67_007755 [Capsicum chacoense]